MDRVGVVLKGGRAKRAVRGEYPGEQFVRIDVFRILDLNRTVLMGSADLAAGGPVRERGKYDDEADQEGRADQRAARLQDSRSLLDIHRCLS